MGGLAHAPVHIFHHGQMCMGYCVERHVEESPQLVAGVALM